MPKIGDDWKKQPLWGTKGAITAICCMGGGGGGNAAAARTRAALARIRDRCLATDGDSDDEMSLTGEDGLVVFKHLLLGDHGGFYLAAWGQERKAKDYLTRIIGRKKTDKLLELWGITKEEKDNRPPGVTEEEWAALEKMKEDEVEAEKPASEGA